MSSVDDTTEAKALSTGAAADTTEGGAETGAPDTTEQQITTQQLTTVGGT